MTCIATIQTIGVAPDGTGTGVNNTCTVVFSDDVTGYTQTKVYAFPSTSTIQADRAIIQADLNTLKALLASSVNLQQYVGAVLT
jgi:hypothetical protein